MKFLFLTLCMIFSTTIGNEMIDYVNEEHECLTSAHTIYGRPQPETYENYQNEQPNCDWCANYCVKKGYSINQATCQIQGSYSRCKCFKSITYPIDGPAEPKSRPSSHPFDDSTEPSCNWCPDYCLQQGYAKEDAKCTIENRKAHCQCIRPYPLVNQGYEPATAPSQKSNCSWCPDYCIKQGYAANQASCTPEGGKAHCSCSREKTCDEWCPEYCVTQGYKQKESTCHNGCCGCIPSGTNGGFGGNYGKLSCDWCPNYCVQKGYQRNEATCVIKNGEAGCRCIPRNEYVISRPY